MTVRVRFAPSPTGYLHVGAARTALYNYLFARANDGTFILRSDDTDTARSTDEFQEDILEHMQWLGLEWDEGVARGGEHGSYRQSDRYGRYREVAHDLIADGSAYYSFATPDQLESFKQAAREAGTSPAYDGSLEPLDADIARLISDGESAVVRFRVPRPGETRFTDIVRDEMVFDHKQVDDFIILRSDGTPTYHLASTVDDVDYGITHVIRGEDLLSSTPKHILLAEAMDADPATYAHLSLLMGPDGKKLSKRHGDTAMSAYREAGLLPEAINNYLALLGWSLGDDEEIASISEMIGKFDLNSVSKNPAVFDPQKLEWLNGVYIRDMDDEEFVGRTLASVEDDLGRSLSGGERAQFDAIAPLVKERTKLLTEVADQVRFLFSDIDEYDEKSWAKVMDKPEGPVALDAAASVLSVLEPWTTEAIEGALRGMLESTGLNARKGFQPVRVAISGSTVSPPLFECLEILGKVETLARIARARSEMK
ncbi:MAG: glutamate--tRNA ligase [Actinobacteria bacterium]|nr:MAG: glutamate--tRNA ligase [Actinomycetota bacterium]